jgi:hypothetical protein
MQRIFTFFKILAKFFFHYINKLEEFQMSLWAFRKLIVQNQEQTFNSFHRLQMWQCLHYKIGLVS